jgi:hypothetical protein
MAFESFAKHIRTFEAKRGCYALKIISRDQHALARFLDTRFDNKLRGGFAKGFIEQAREISPRHAYPLSERVN